MLREGIIMRFSAGIFPMKRYILFAIPLALAVVFTLFPSLRAGGSFVVEVYKSASCGCCGGWEEHLRAAGFSVRSHAVEDVSAMREKLGMLQAYASCHTARVGNYLIEGHVPAADVRRLLAERPEGIGLAAPGMPQGSPGMEFGASQDYDVLLILQDGRAEVFQHHPAR
jgi:hypothetical protein